MLHSEFVERTKFYPTQEQFAEIHKEYLQTDKTKETFCREWKQKHLTEASKENALLIEKLCGDNFQLCAQIKQLQKQLAEANLQVLEYKRKMNQIRLMTE